MTTQSVLRMRTCHEKFILADLDALFMNRVNIKDHAIRKLNLLFCLNLILLVFCYFQGKMLQRNLVMWLANIKLNVIIYSVSSIYYNDSRNASLFITVGFNFKDYFSINKQITYQYYNANFSKILCLLYKS